MSRDNIFENKNVIITSNLNKPCIDDNILNTIVNGKISRLTFLNLDDWVNEFISNIKPFKLTEKWLDLFAFLDVQLNEKNYRIKASEYGNMKAIVIKNITIQELISIYLLDNDFIIKGFIKSNSYKNQKNNNSLGLSDLFKTISIHNRKKNFEDESYLPLKNFNVEYFNQMIEQLMENSNSSKIYYDVIIGEFEQENRNMDNDTIYFNTQDEYAISLFNNASINNDLSNEFQNIKLLIENNTPNFKNSIEYYTYDTKPFVFINNISLETLNNLFIPFGMDDIYKYKRYYIHSIIVYNKKDNSELKTPGLNAYIIQIARNAYNKNWLNYIISKNENTNENKMECYQPFLNITNEIIHFYNNYFTKILIEEYIFKIAISIESN